MNSNVYIELVRTERMKGIYFERWEAGSRVNKWHWREAKDGHQASTDQKKEISIDELTIEYCDAGPFSSTQVKLVCIMYFDPAYNYEVWNLFAGITVWRPSTGHACCVRGGWPLQWRDVFRWQTHWLGYEMAKDIKSGLSTVLDCKLPCDLWI